MLSEPFENAGGCAPDQALEGWIAQARTGDRSALGAALAAEGAALLLFARKKICATVASQVRPSDVVQDTFLNATRYFATFRGATVVEWRGWLRIILKNVLSTRRRRGDSPPESDGLNLEDPQLTPSAATIRREKMQALLQAVESLPDEYRSIILARHIEGEGFPEIGARLGKTDEAVRKIRNRALLKLKDMLGPGHDSQWEPGDARR